MKGDFSRITFEPTKNFTAVLMQQGRVQLDADWNEQAAITLWQIRSLGRAIVGPHGGPDDAFLVVASDNKHLKATKGTYFVDGIACTIAGDRQLSLPDKATQNVDYLVYLDVWERVVTYIEASEIAEPALGTGIDTTLRTQVNFEISIDKPRAAQPDPPPDIPTLTAGLKDTAAPKTPCVISPDSGYRGEGNQLYRVEIHGVLSGKTMFKWSRENGSVVFPVTSFTGSTVTLASLGRDERFTLEAGDFVEIEHAGLPRNEVRPLARVKSVQTDDKTVTLDSIPTGFRAGNGALLRRWDHALTDDEGLFEVIDDKALDLENGLQVTFNSPSGQQGYLVGDYWLIPARTTAGWKPSSKAQPAQRSEHGSVPIASFTLLSDGTIDTLKDLRHTFKPLAQP